MVTRTQSGKSGVTMQARRLARERALQALYQWDMNPEASGNIREQFLASQDMSKVDIEYFSELLQKTVVGADELDRRLESYLDIPVEKLDPIERCVLRLSTYELTSRPEIPYRVIINEAVALTKKYGASDGHKFVNGVLDRAARDMRPHEH